MDSGTYGPPPWARDDSPSGGSNSNPFASFYDDLPPWAAQSEFGGQAASTAPPWTQTQPSGVWTWADNYRPYIGQDDISKLRNILEGPRISPNSSGIKASQCEWIEYPADGVHHTRFLAYFQGMPQGTFEYLPRGAKVAFRGYQTDEGYEYFQNTCTSEVTWHLPLPGWTAGPEASLAQKMLRTGMCVELTNMRKLNYLTGARAMIVNFLPGNRCVVTVNSIWLDLVVSLASLKPLGAGQIVRIAFNPFVINPARDDGHAGEWVRIRRTLYNYDTKEVCYEADRVQALQQNPALEFPVVKVPSTRLTPSRLEGMEVGPKINYLQWASNEQGCNFCTSQGILESFDIHFPIGYHEVRNSLEFGESARWPLMVWMHGSGGGSFLGSSGKKGLHTAGISYAAENFIIVTPRCRWKWKQTPENWVLELVDELSKAAYVDPSRIYLTGVSMGGMGTWELAMRRPGLFAAIAPVGAYHKKDLRSQIADALVDTPIYCVQSKIDTTCPLAPELELYRELQARGAKLRVDVHPSLNHTQIHKAYEDSNHLYKWLLSQTSKSVECPDFFCVARDV